VGDWGLKVGRLEDADVDVDVEEDVEVEEKM